MSLHFFPSVRFGTPNMVGVLALLAGCSSSTAVDGRDASPSQPDTAAMEAGDAYESSTAVDGRDASPPQPDTAVMEAGDACEASALWTPNSTDFELRVWAGPRLAPPTAVCPHPDVTYTFSTVTKTLTEVGCKETPPYGSSTLSDTWVPHVFVTTDASIVLSEAEVASLLETLQAFRTPCGQGQCILDIPAQQLTIRDGSTQTPKVYIQDSSGCPGSKPQAGSYLSSMDVYTLESQLLKLLALRAGDAGAESGTQCGVGESCSDAALVPAGADGGAGADGLPDATR